ncbi:hypothetical protein Tco_0490243 [Tanacetum coccineum]
MIKESVVAAIATKRARHANAGNNVSGSGQARVAIELRRWFEKTEMTFGIRMEVTSSKLTSLNEAVRMAHKLMEQKLQARNERILEGNKGK